MKAQEIMITHVYKVKKHDTVRAVIEKFIDHRISGLPVVNERNEIVAYISDGDIMRYIGKHQDLVVDFVYHTAVFKGDIEDFESRAHKLLKVPVMEIARKKVIVVSADEELEQVAAILGKRQIKKLPVERRGVLVGIISRGDVIRQVFKQML